MRSIKWWCFRWPWVTLNPPNHPNFCIFSSPFISSYWVNVETSYLVYRLTLASPSRWMTNRPWKGRGYVTWHVLNFGCPIRISGMAEARALKFFHKVLPNRWQITPKRGVVLLTWPIFCMHSCGVVHSPRHSPRCYQQMRARRTLLFAPTALEATHAKA